MRGRCRLLFRQSGQVAHILAALDLTVLIILLDYYYSYLRFKLIFSFLGMSFHIEHTNPFLCVESEQYK